jgi:hypothetical protein
LLLGILVFLVFDMQEFHVDATSRIEGHIVPYGFFGAFWLPR